MYGSTPITVSHDVQATVTMRWVPPARSSPARNGTAFKHRGHFRLKISTRPSARKAASERAFRIVVCGFDEQRIESKANWAARKFRQAMGEALGAKY
jgi:hypothetical protein